MNAWSRAWSFMCRTAAGEPRVSGRVCDGEVLPESRPGYCKFYTLAETGASARAQIR